MNKILSIAVSILLISCAGKNLVDNPVFLTDHHFVTLIHPSMSVKTWETMQILQGRYQETNFSLHSFLISNDSEISISVFSTLGNTLLELSYNGQELESSGIMNTLGMDYHYIIADIQFCYYPENILKTALDAYGFFLESQENSDGWMRKIYHDDVLIMKIERKKSIVELINYSRDYSYIIEELDS